MTDAIEYLGRESQYCKNLYKFRWTPGTEEQDYLNYIKQRRLDDDYFGSHVMRFNDQVHVYIYTD